VNYGKELVAVVQNNRVLGCQFHPEKSQSAGLKVLENFFSANHA
jgi:imidazole glycerol-phosphate synthase subunit HisH